MRQTGLSTKERPGATAGAIRATPCSPSGSIVSAAAVAETDEARRRVNGGTPVELATVPRLAAPPGRRFGRRSEAGAHDMTTWLPVDPAPSASGSGSDGRGTARVGVDVRGFGGERRRGAGCIVAGLWVVLPRMAGFSLRRVGL
jgi:hypothetical protein